jgi:ribosome-associated protein
LAAASLRAARASGPGGQHVNKTSTAVELRFDAAACAALPQAVRARLARLAGTRMTADGVLLLFSQEHRSQALNREAVMARLEALLRRAAVAPKRRRPTRPTLASRRERLESKVRRGGVKSLRGKVGADDA